MDLSVTSASPSTTSVPQSSTYNKSDNHNKNNINNEIMNSFVPMDSNQPSGSDSTKISAYARLDFSSFTFYIQTLQVLLGRRINNDQSYSVDVHLGPTKAVSRKHAKIFYNFGTQRFEIQVLGRNGLFIDNNFVEKGVTVPLSNDNKIQIGQVTFTFVLPNGEDIKISKPEVQTVQKKQQQQRQQKQEQEQEQQQQQQQQQPIPPKQPETLSSNVVPPKVKQPKAVVNNNAMDIIPKIKPETLSIIPTTVNIPLTNTALKTDPVMATPMGDKSIDQILALAKSTGTIINTSTIPLTNHYLQETQQKQQEVKKPNVIVPKKEKRTTKPPKKVYTLEEIPEEYRTKPATSYSNIIIHCLRTYSTDNKGMSLSEIYKSIQDLYPYYKFCPDGWQSSVRHNLSLNKAFKKISKEGKGWLWGIDEDYFAEKDKAKKKQPIEPINRVLPNVPLVNSMLLPNSIINQYSASTIPSSRPLLSNSLPLTNTAIGSTYSSYSKANSGTAAVKVANNNKATNNKSSSNKLNLSEDNKKILNILQEQLKKITKNIKGLNKETVIKLLTHALSSTMNQLQKNANGQSLIKYVEKNPQQLTKILTNSLNNATTHVTNGKMTFAELISGKVKSTAPKPATTAKPNIIQNLRPSSIPLIPLKPTSATKPTIIHAPIPSIARNTSSITQPKATPVKIEPVRQNQTAPPAPPPPSSVSAPSKKPRTASLIALESNLDKLLAGEEALPVKSEVPKKRTDSLIAFEQNLDRFLAGEENLFHGPNGNNAGDHLSKINESAIDDDDDDETEPNGSANNANKSEPPTKSEISVKSEANLPKTDPSSSLKRPLDNGEDDSLRKQIKTEQGTG
ncbi:Fhl1 protein [Saccharomycopsis crataegensis]|uniref:Fhl1 protein n=1 Tax=Saccharomycopsis crataegensis TaxID=43959 RepID=A0AAV5QH66_9ASCO|nr:Fhl1 protein [Saccharomycopsis crataegensis]